MAKDIRVSGLKELTKELRTLPNNLKKKTVRRSVAAAAKVVLTQAKSNAPRRTGALRRSIARRSRSSRGRKDLITQSIYVRTGANRAKGQVTKGEDPYYWWFIENGFEAVGRSPRKGRKKSGRKIPGKRFMSRAFDSTKGRALVVFRRTFSQELRQYRGGRV